MLPPIVVILTVLTLSAFGVFYAIFVRWSTRDDGQEPNTAYFVVVGVAVTVTAVMAIANLFGHPELFPLPTYYLLIIGFASSGWPMIYEYVDRHSKWRIFSLRRRD